MFAVAMDLLAYRYTAMQFNDRSEAEWPPHPARFFSALVAAWADADEPDAAERDALRWLEQQPPPAVTCGDVRRRHVVTHFVPVNDPKALPIRDVSRTYTALSDARHALLEAGQSADERAVQRARTALTRAETKAIADAGRAESASVAAGVLEVLPDNRGKQGRTYPTVIPDQPTVWFIWPDAAPDERYLRALDRLLDRVGRVGHSSTLVACHRAADAPTPTWVPSNDETGTRLRVPRAGLMDRLELAFGSHRGKEPRVLPAGMTNYRRPSAPRPDLAHPLLGGDWLVLEIPGRHLPSTARTLDIARATRNALLKHGDQPPPEILSGHQSRAGAEDRPTPPLDRPHLAVVPLPNAGHAYSDGAVLGVALVLPADCSDADRAAVERAVRGWSAARFELLLPGGAGGSALRLTVQDRGIERAAGNVPAWLNTDLAGRRRTITRDYWCRSARRWLTVTPIALDRFPGNLRSPHERVRDRAEAEAVASVAKACSFAGLPRPAEVTIRLDAPLTGIPAAPAGQRRGSRHVGRCFPGYQTGSGAPRVCVHAEIEFETDVRGPVLLGAGRYFGYGLCLPWTSEGSKR